ncbi:cobalt/nickel transport system ATP-binding protein [Tessaracoccus bendigoensis DSM 12906]|uniref:ABC transporter ATP-binding protein n=1 Tax=Tessaracoccus bendigoensis DSM 12906 TaxID=1123357 RepID=A0A1M6LC48_9ACTN|nr:ATP-binding cassette domain-containing protein [Tessaracoccus bendigoensis]SHJ68749.1 cobalt/nickel transport system ATP-binding protein [Tessaracoccus bendigoensis DSM 12906]
MTALLEAAAVTLGFHDHVVLRDASLTIRRGSRIALLGANGSGKTTLLSALSGALEPSVGVVRFGGQDLRHDRRNLREHRRHVQLVLQDPDDQLFSADVTQDVSFGPLNLGLDEATAWARVEEALNLLSVTHLAERPTHQLSYGERKRVAIAGAVAMRPEVLLLDEPTAGLDPVGVAELMATLAGLGTTVVLATHDVDLALSWADEVAVVSDGGVRQGTPSLLLDAALIRSARLRMPWQLELVTRLGLPVDPLPRTIDDVLTRIGR